MKKYLLLLVTLIAIVVGYLVYKNTGLLTLKVPSETIESNNTNNTKPIEISAGQNLVKLEKTVLNVPEEYKNNAFSKERVLLAPKGFEVSVFAAGMTKPRFFDFDENNNMYVTDTNFFTTKSNGGEVFVLSDVDQNGIAEEIITVDQNLNNPHGIDYYKGDLYVGEETQVVVYRQIKPDGSYSRKEVLIANLPTKVTFQTGSGHVTRTVVIGPDEKIYVSIGSSCNVCEEDDSRRASIQRYNMDGSFDKAIATGLRNTVGFEFRKENEFEYLIWGVDNGRDLLGDNLPPEEINVISLNSKETPNYGWPYCYGKGIVNPEFKEKEDFCKNSSKSPLVEMQAHSAPLGISFHPFVEKGDSVRYFPDSLNNNLFVAFHGSWNKTQPTGYKVVRLDALDLQVINFITGWLDEKGDVWGRPVDVGFDTNGVMYISDDLAGAIYKVTYNK